jgi:hypothetical protein
MSAIVRRPPDLHSAKIDFAVGSDGKTGHRRFSEAQYRLLGGLGDGFIQTGRLVGLGGWFTCSGRLIAGCVGLVRLRFVSLRFVRRGFISLGFVGVGFARFGLVRWFG